MPQLAAIRAAVDLPLDVYVEAPDDFGGFVRHYEVPEMIRVASPMYVKLGLRNAANIYPSGMHIEDLAVKQSQERVHRTALVMKIIQAVRARRGDGRGWRRGFGDSGGLANPAPVLVRTQPEVGRQYETVRTYRHIPALLRLLPRKVTQSLGYWAT